MAIPTSFGETPCAHSLCKKSWLLWHAAIGFLFCSFLMLTLLTPLISDDYNYRFSFSSWQRIGSVADIFASMQAHYFNSNGRLVPHFFAQLMLWLGKPLFAVCNASMFIALLLGINRIAFGREKHSLHLLVIGASLFVILPRFAQTMLWLTGACNYLWGSTLIIWTMVPFRDCMLGEAAVMPKWKVAFILPWYAFMGATSENFSPAALLFMGLCMLYLRILRKKAKPWMFAAIALGILGFLFMLASPASQRRNAASLSATASFAGKFLEPFANAMQMYLDHALVVTLVFFLLLSVALHADKSKPHITLAIFLFLCGFLSNLAMAATGYYPHRAMSGCLFLFIASCLVLCCQLRTHPLHAALRGVQWFIIFFAMLLVLQAAPSIYDRYREASAREQKIIAEQKAGSTSAVTYHIQGRTKFDVFFDMIDLTYDPSYFANAVFARYYDLDSVVIDETR